MSEQNNDYPREDDRNDDLDESRVPDRATAASRTTIPRPISGAAE
jgi:hypothetical protein